MSWSYSGNPAGSNMDAIRFEIGDTLSTDPLLQDEEILYVLTMEDGIIPAAARCCEAIVSHYSREADNSIGSTRVAASQRARAYADRATALRKKAGAKHAPLVPGLSPNYKDQLATDTSLVQPRFEDAKFDDPNATSYEKPTTGV